MPLSDDVRARLEADAAQIIGRYPRSRSALLPLLHLVQAEEGFVSEDGLAFCAGQLGLTEADVTAVASFYTMYKRQPVGEYHVGVCTNALCAVMGGDAIFADLQKHLGIGNNETTPDGKVSLEHLECNAACDYAPVVMVNWEFFDNQTPSSARDLVDGLRGGQLPRPTRDGQLGVLRQHDPAEGAGSRGWPAGRPGRRPAQPRRPPPVHLEAGRADPGRLPRRPGGRGEYRRRREPGGPADGTRAGLDPR